MVRLEEIGQLYRLRDVLVDHLCKLSFQLAVSTIRLCHQFRRKSLLSSDQLSIFHSVTIRNSHEKTYTNLKNPGKWSTTSMERVMQVNAGDDQISTRSTTQDENFEDYTYAHHVKKAIHFAELRCKGSLLQDLMRIGDIRRPLPTSTEPL
jgi:hypothetical protein